MRITSGGSWYFPQANHFEAESHNNGGFSYHVSFRANLKNYEEEIEAFFEWIMPHVITDGFIGYSLYEEAKEPTFYYKETDNG